MLVHWLLIELDVPHTLSLVDLASKAHKHPDYLALNSGGVVPTLVIDGKPHCEAAALAVSLVDAHPVARLAPPFDSPQRRVHAMDVPSRQRRAAAAPAVVMSARTGRR